MNYRLLLKLPFEVALVHVGRFTDPDQARAAAADLPGAFEVVPEDGVDLEKAIEVPIRLEKSRKNDENR